MQWWRSPVTVGVFVVADVAALVGGYRLIHRPAPPPPPASSTPPSAVPTTSTSAATSVTPPLALRSSPSGAVLRATRGSCDPRYRTTPAVYLAVKQDAPLQRVRVPGLAEVLGSDLTDTTVRLVGADSGCRLHGYESRDAGRTWRTTAVFADVYYLDPNSTASLFHHGADDLATSCVPQNLTPLPGRTPATDQVLVACQSYDVVRTPARSGSRTPPASYTTTDSAQAVSIGGTLLALGQTSTCRTALVVLGTATTPASVAGARSRSCLSQSALGTGLTAQGDRVWAQVGNRLELSTDGGRDFRVYPGQ